MTGQEEQEQMEVWFEPKDKCDLIIRSNDQKGIFHVHSFFLQCQSKFFREFTFNESMEWDGNKNIIQMALSFLYNTECDEFLGLDEWIQTAYLFNKYQLETCISACSTTLYKFFTENEDDLTYDEIAQLVKAAEECHISHLYKLAIQFLSKQTFTEELVCKLSTKCKADLFELSVKKKS